MASPRLRQLLDEQGWRCGLCRARVEAIEDANIDHIVPKASGGTRERGNLHATHVWCNHLKGSGLTVFSCIACRAVFRYEPNFEAHWPRCKARRIEAELLALARRTLRAAAGKGPARRPTRVRAGPAPRGSGR